MKTQDPIKLLRQEHDAVLEVVDRMELAVSDLQGSRREEALSTLREALDYLEKEVRAHGQKEEEYLYPALGRHVPKLTIDVMLEEHRDLWWRLDAFARVLSTAEPSLNDLRWKTTAVVDLLRRHIDKENDVLFMMAAQMLSDREYADLSRAFEAMK
jgi:hemerythrin-like domain-containing protein